MKLINTFNIKIFLFCKQLFYGSGMKSSQITLKIKHSLIKSTIEIKRFLAFWIQRAQNDTILRVSSSLSYTSLIALVPVLAIALAIFSAFPVFADVREQLQELILKNFVPSTEQEISIYLNEFINATAKLTTVGVVGLAVTAILLLSTIENSFNFIFKVHKPRRIATKITLYWTVITLGPLLMGAALSLRGYIYTIQNYMSETTHPWITYSLPSLLNLIILMMIYILVPNRKVRISHAAIGAAVAIFLFWIIRKIFSLMILSSATYKTLYGALAALPIFLVWMYLVWAVVIFGAIVTASMDDFIKEQRQNKESKKS